MKLNTKLENKELEKSNLILVQIYLKLKKINNEI